MQGWEQRRTDLLPSHRSCHGLLLLLLLLRVLRVYIVLVLLKNRWFDANAPGVHLFRSQKNACDVTGFPVGGEAILLCFLANLSNYIFGTRKSSRCAFAAASCRELNQISVS